MLLRGGFTIRGSHFFKEGFTIRDSHFGKGEVHIFGKGG